MTKASNSGRKLRPSELKKSKVSVKSTKRAGLTPTRGISKFMAALATLGGLFGNAGVFRPKASVKKSCLNCGTTHYHNNAYCSAHCCHVWREENPQRGRGNHYFGEFLLAYKTTPDGWEVQVSK